MNLLLSVGYWVLALNTLELSGCSFCFGRNVLYAETWKLLLNELKG